MIANINIIKVIPRGTKYNHESGGVVELDHLEIGEVVFVRTPGDGK